MIYVLGAFLIGIPIASVIYFAMSLYDYLRVKKANSGKNDTNMSAEMKKSKVNLVVSSVIMAVLLSVIITFTLMLYFAIAYM